MSLFLLIVLDGWGISEPNKGNAIGNAKIPFYDSLMAKYPHTQLEASGPAVGLPPGEDGNSEVGHLNLGAGRIVYQDLPRIDIKIADNSFYKLPGLVNALKQVKEKNSKLNLMGLIGSGSVHSSVTHLFALLRAAAREGLSKDQVQLHLFTDGRDSPLKQSVETLELINRKIEEIGVGVICSISGRYFAMDRNKNWDRTERVYHLLTLGEGNKAGDALSAVKNSHSKSVTDEFIEPTAIIGSNGQPLGIVNDGDAVIFYNYRPDRARQLTQSFVAQSFKGFERRKKFDDLYFVSMTEYDREIPVSAILFERENIRMPLSEVISKEGFKQFHVAETEKYAHVTYFFNGGQEDPFLGEDRVLVPSPQVDTYDKKPQMSAEEITNLVLEKLDSGLYNFLVVNFANADMVAHSGDLQATTVAVEFIDGCLERLITKTLELGGSCIVTADHGNAEEMLRGWRGERDTKHSTNPVPMIIVSKEFEGKADLRLSTGVLGDVAPTILYLMDIPQPMEMTGRVLFT